MLSDDLRREILHAILRPEPCLPGLREQVQTFLYELLGIDSYDRFGLGSPEPHDSVVWGSSYRWDFCFDARGKLVPFFRSDVPYGAVQGFTKVTTSVSGRGPYVSAESATVSVWDRWTGFKQELPASAKAAALAQAVAKRFGLTYLDAAELYGWELDESIADAVGADVQDAGWEVPNAFILLFR